MVLVLVVVVVERIGSEVVTSARCAKSVTKYARVIEHDAGVLLMFGIVAIRDRRRRGSDVSAAPARMLALVSSKRGEYMFALYSGSVAEPGDRNPYAGSESLVLPKLWLRGYMRMLRVRIDTGPAMVRYRGARVSDEAVEAIPCGED